MICICQYCGKRYSTYEEAKACEKACQEKQQAREQKRLREREYWSSVRKTIGEGNQMFGRSYFLSEGHPFSPLFDGQLSPLWGDVRIS